MGGAYRPAFFTGSTPTVAVTLVDTGAYDDVGADILEEAFGSVEDVLFIGMLADDPAAEVSRDEREEKARTRLFKSLIWCQ